MYDIIATYFFRFSMYVFFGLCMEIFVGAVVNAIENKFKNNSHLLIGDVSMWMIPIYGFCILFIFEPIYQLIHSFPNWVRYVIWMFGFTGIEFLSGYIYNKILGKCPWDYSSCNDSILGFTRINLIPWWGLCGLIFESYSNFIINLSKCLNLF